MSGIPWESEERQNHIRADYIVSDVVRKELRNFFIREWNKRRAWDDTNVSGSQLFNLEKSRARPNKAMLQSKFKHGDTNYWDCNVLFDAIFFSNSIGASLNPMLKTEIDNLRKLRNEITHKAEKTLDDADFQTKTTNVIKALNALGLSSNEVVRIKNLYKSFQILPPKPTREVVSRSDKIHEIRKDLEKLRSDNDGKLTYFYISGNPGSGKSQLARQVCDDIWENVHAKHEAMFVMTLNGKDIDSVLNSYEDFCRKLNCNESVLKNLLSSSKPKDEKIKDLRSQISNRIKHWKKWWIIVDNVENLELVSPLLPLMSDDVWNNGQIIVTTQNTNAVPSDSLSSKHISLSPGMNDEEYQSGKRRKMSGIPWESEERQNYIRADYIVSDVVRKELRSFFIQEWNKRRAWDDTNVSGSQLFNLEKSRARPNKAMLQSKFNHGNTNEWDCTVLFDAILFSNSIGASLNPTQKTEIDNLRKLRNEITHKPEKTLDDADFQTKTTNVINALNALGLTSTEVVRVKNLYKSFQVLPPAPTHEIVSRSDKIHEIRKDLEKLRSDNDGKLTYFYISGNPGSGKSQLARQVFESISNEVGWLQERMFVMTLDGKDVDSLLHSYKDFCRRLNCDQNVLHTTLSSSNPNENKIKDLRSQICSRIKNWKKWWIIVDNVENFELISPLLPLLGDEAWNNGQIILTIQNINSVPSDSISTRHISLSLGMNDHECHKLLALLSRTDVNDPLLDEVAEKLDRQPLAIAAAAVYIRQVIEIHSNFSWPNYLEELEKGRELTEERLKQTNSAAYSLTMSAAVLLAVTKCAEESKILAHAFNLFSLISFEPLPLDLVVKYVQQEEEELDAEDIIHAIKQCSLFVHVGSKDEDIHLHRVVHQVIKLLCPLKRTDIGNSLKTAIPNEGQNIRKIIHNVTNTLYSFEDRKDKMKMIPHLKAFLTEINRLFPNQVESLMSSAFDKTENPQLQMYRFFGRTLCDFSEFSPSMEIFQQTLKIVLQKFGPNHIALVSCYSDLGTLCYKKGELEQASDYYQRALKIELAQMEPNHSDIAGSYNNLGVLCKDKGDLEQACDYHERALKIQLGQLGPNHSDVAASYNNLGALCHMKGDLKQASDYYQQALKIQLEQFGSNHTVVASLYNNLGSVCNDKGYLEQASDYHERALKIQLQELGPNHVDVAGSYNNLGNVCHDKGDLEKANDYYEQALKIRLEQLGPNHVDVAGSYNNLGILCSDKGDLEQACDYHQQALKIRLERLGSNHVVVARSYNNLGTLCKDKGDLEQAKDYHQRALKIQLEQLGPNHVDIAGLYNNLGILRHKKGDFEQAINYHQKALKIQLEQLGPNHVNVANSYNNLGVMYRDKGDLKQASDYHKRALKIQLEQLRPNHVDLAMSYNNLGTLCKDNGDLEQAKDYHQRALKIQLEKLGPNHVDVATSYNNLGTLCKDKGDLEQARDYHQQALKIRLEQLGPNHVDLATSYYNLGNLCDDKGDLKEARDYHQQALKIRLEQLGPNHVDVARSYNNLGIVCKKKGDLEQASDYYQQALKIKLEQLGPNHVDVATSYNNLGIVCRDKGDLEQASDYYQRALKIQLEQLGPNHVDLVSIYNNLGIVCSDKGDLDQASDYHQRVLKIRLKQFGPNHVDVAASFYQLGVVCLSKRDLDHARDYLQQALNIQLEKLGPIHKDVLRSYLYLGTVCFEKEDLEDASHYFKSYYEILLELLESYHNG